LSYSKEKKMKDSYLINFSLFCQRRKFNLIEFIKNNKDMKYEEFYKLLIEKNVHPPKQDFYDQCRNKVLAKDDISTNQNIVKPSEKEIKSKNSKKRSYKKNKKQEVK
jgi:hypothetical protein